MDRDQIQPERRPVLLFAFANDERPGRRLGGLCREVEEIRRTLAQAERDGSCEIVVRESTTPAELVEVLEDPRYRRRLTAIHFAGHASGSRLLLEGEGEPIAARIQGLAPLLGELESLAFVFLNGCGTLAQGERLIRAGIPAVVATEQPVEDEQAQRFAVDFYRNLAGGASISEAFARAFAQAQCFVPAQGIVRDLVLAPEDEEPPTVWRLLLADPHGDAKDWSLSTAVDDPLFGLPAPVGGVLPQEPFMGLRRFTARESAVLFGRGRAIRNLYRDVTDPTIPSLVVVYGASGVGKSSLLEAGLLPRVAAGHEVHDLRLERGQDPEGLLRHVLADADGRVDLASAWRARERARGRAVVICIDQLEALVLGEDGARALARFVQALKPLGGPERPQGKLLLGLRKEWFAELRNELKRHDIEWHDHFVEPLGRDDIEEVVLGPTRTASLRARYGITCEDGLARRIADDLSQDRRSAIAPMLQILLTRMWERTEPQLTSVDGRVRRRFTLETYDELRRDGLALSDFVDRQLEALRVTHAEALASGLVLELLFRHTTPRGTAAASTYGQLRERYAHRWEVVERLVERCVSLYLLQVVSDVQGVDTGVRLAHDTLAPIVRDRYLQSKAPAQAATRLLEARMGMSEASGRSRLLDEHDLEQVEAAQAGMRRWTEEEERLVDESRRRRKWAVWMGWGKLAVIVVSLAVAVVAVWVNRESEPSVERLFATAAPEPESPTVESEEPRKREVEPPPDVPAAERGAPEHETKASIPDLGTSVFTATPATADREHVQSPRARVERSQPSCDLRRVPVPTGGKLPVETLVTTADGARLAVGMKTNKVYVIEPSEASIESTITTAKEVNALAWSPDGRLLAIGEQLGRVEIVRRDGTAYSEPLSCQQHDRAIRTLAFSADGEVLLTADIDGGVLTRDPRTSKRLHELALEEPIHGIHEVRNKASSEWFLAGGSGLMTWDGSDSSASPFSGKPALLKTITRASGDGRVIAAGGHLQIWARSGELLADRSFKPLAKQVFVNEREELLITVTSSGVALWPLPRETTKSLKPLDTWAHKGVEDVAVYPDLHDVLVVTADGRVRWLPREGKEFGLPRSLDVEAADDGKIVLDPRLDYFAVGDQAGHISLVTLPTARDQARKCTLNNVQ